MAYTKITFLDRISEHPNRRRFINAETQVALGTYDIERAEGIVTENGTPYSSQTFNDMQDNIEAAIGVEVIETLTAGQTSITLQEEHISTADTCTLEFKTNIFGVSPTAVSVSAGSVTLTFPAQSTDMRVKAVVKYDVV